MSSSLSSTLSNSIGKWTWFFPVDLTSSHRSEKVFNFKKNYLNHEYYVSEGIFSSANISAVKDSTRAADLQTSLPFQFLSI